MVKKGAHLLETIKKGADLESSFATIDLNETLSPDLSNDQFDYFQPFLPCPDYIQGDYVEF